MAEAETINKNTETAKIGTDKENDSGFGTMPGTLTLEGNEAASILKNRNSIASSKNITSNYTDENTNQNKLSEYNAVLDISDYDLVNALEQVHYFDTYYLDNYYYNNKLNCTTLQYNFVKNYYEPIFSGRFMATQAHIDEFYARINKAGGVENYAKNTGMDEAKIKTLFSYANQPGLLKRIKTDGDLFMERVKKIDELNAIITSVNEDKTKFYDIEVKSIQRNLTQADVDQVPTFKTNAQRFITLYNNSEASLKSCFSDDFNKIATQITKYDNFITEAPERLKWAEKKRLNAGKNPLPSGDGSYYARIRKKKGKEDKPNKRVLKKWGVYQQTEKEEKKEGEKKSKKVKVDEYSIYKKDKEGKDADEVDMNDAIQGALGDCYLISSIAAVAKRRPDLIKSLIQHTPGESSATVTLYLVNPDTQTREAKKTKVNFYFPIKDFKPGYAQKGDDELWVMLIEKAYAQQMGGYDNIVSGDPAEALAVLTGVKPTVTASDSDKLVEQLKTANDKNTPVVAGTKEENEIKAPYTVDKTTGSPIVRLSDGEKVYCSHAYTILEYDETAKKPIKVRNPHGDKEVKYYVPSTFNPGEKEMKSEMFKAEFSITLEEFKACFSALYSSKLDE